MFGVYVLHACVHWGDYKITKYITQGWWCGGMELGERKGFLFKQK